MSSICERILDFLENDKETNLKFGVPLLDDVIGGLFKGELTTIAARSGVGKTALALQIMLNCASQGKKVLFISREMSNEQIVMRNISKKTGISAKSLKYKNLKEIDWKNIIDVIKEEQAKLGYRKEKIRLYYPLSSLNHFFQLDVDETGKHEKLSRFSENEEGKLGSVEVTNKGERFCFHIPEEGAEYVHNNMKENEFIKDLIGLISHHGCKMEDIFELFRQHSDQITIEEMHSDEFDYMICFENDPEDTYRYCFKDEGCHIIYHRFLPEDYEEFGFGK